MCIFGNFQRNWSLNGFNILHDGRRQQGTQFQNFAILFLIGLSIMFQLSQSLSTDQGTKFYQNWQQPFNQFLLCLVCIAQNSVSGIHPIRYDGMSSPMILIRSYISSNSMQYIFSTNSTSILNKSIETITKKKEPKRQALLKRTVDK